MSAMRAWSFFLVVFAFVIGPARAETLLILTSYENEVVTPLVDAFEEVRPDITVRHLNKNTHAAAEEILSGNGRHFDLFWASSAETFELLAARGRLKDVGHGPHADFAFSAVGWAWTAPFDGDPPQEWNDLLDPSLAGRIAMSHPMRSGSTHSLIESMLQHRGWERGWAWLLEMAGQLRTISARSFGVLEGVEQRRWDVGLTIDFLALKRANAGFVFHYGRPIIIIPARIAALEGGAAPEAASAFVEFLLSDRGQELLLHPDVRRIPVNAKVRQMLAETMRPDIRAALQLSWSQYDPRLASRRYEQINRLFDIFVAQDFVRRRDLWRRLRSFEDETGRNVNHIRQMLRHMPISENEAMTSQPDHETLLSWTMRSREALDRAAGLLSEMETVN